MGKERLTAFTDGVVAIIITIMVLELKLPSGVAAADLLAVVPRLLIYLLSFVYVAIYWNNHHHMMHLANSVNGAILWANMHLLFWLSLTPFATAWIGESHLAALPVALYGGMMLMTAIAYTILMTVLVTNEGPDSALAQAMGRDIKGKLSLAIYAAGAGLAFVQPWASIGCYALVSLIWFIPDRRVERTLQTP
ncbi:MAG TPA: TMEM175 family protein [Phenylobacterium sp.]|nr:TMEM175 family protein [Phenylobacterium sp.]